MSSSKLSVGIVGLPNAGKSTLFNALASRRLAETAPRPFTTIDPNEAVVGVPDERLKKLVDIIKPQKTLPATVTFIDIAGLIKGAHKGEGLGNQFLGKIREVDAIVHVVAAFGDQSAAEIMENIEVVNLELELGEIEAKPTIYVLNLAENGNTRNDELSTQIKKRFGGEVIELCAKLEEELIDLEESERTVYLNEVGFGQSGLVNLIQKSYQLLGLITFYTIKGGKEVSAWSLESGGGAIVAAAKVHSDFAAKFIKAEVIGVHELLGLGTWKKAKEKGKVRLEGKDYVVRDGDVIEFRVGV